MSARSPQRSRLFRHLCAHRVAELLDVPGPVAPTVTDGELLSAADAVAAFVLGECSPRVTAVRWTEDYPNRNEAPSLSLVRGEQEQCFDIHLCAPGAHPQPGNRGGRSFLADAFGARDEQRRFNAYLDRELTTFYHALAEDSGGVSTAGTLRDLRAELRRRGVSSEQLRDPHGKSGRARRRLLHRLREELHRVLTGIAAETPEVLQLGYRRLLLRHLDRRVLVCHPPGDVEELIYPAVSGPPRLARWGNDTVGLRFPEIEVTLRLKFESGPLSAMKLAVGCPTVREHSPSQQRREIERLLETARRRCLDSGHDATRPTRTAYRPTLVAEPSPPYRPRSAARVSDACGKALEMLACLHVAGLSGARNRAGAALGDELAEQATHLPPATWEQLERAGIVAAREIVSDAEARGHGTALYVEHRNQAYLRDRLDTSDLVVGGRREDGAWFERAYSLKAAAHPPSRIGIKNPGAGKLLGPAYFDLVGDLDMQKTIAALRREFERGRLSPTSSTEGAEKSTPAHRAVLRQFADCVQRTLESALASHGSQALEAGVRALLGVHPIVIVAYAVNPVQCRIVDSAALDPAGTTSLERVTPNTLRLTFGGVTILLRVKFAGSTRQPNRWSALKLMVDLELPSRRPGRG